MKRFLLTAAALSTAIPGPALAGTLVLNTGYNNGVPLAIGQQDQTWIKIASYEPPVSAPVAAAWVISTGGYSTLPGAQWLAPRSSPLSTTGPNSTSPSRPAYSIFRKCFCLLDTAGAQLSLRVRADDNVQVWLNSVLNTLAPPQAGQLSSGLGIPYPSLPQYPANPHYFRLGRNCIYVLVEDTVANGAIGFTLAGTVSAPGLMPNAATGVNGNFGPCGCPTEPNSADVGPGTVGPGTYGPGTVAPGTFGPGTVGHGTPHADQAGDSAAVQAIVNFAEARRLAHGEAPAAAAAPQP